MHLRDLFLSGVTCALCASTADASPRHERAILPSRSTDSQASPLQKRAIIPTAPGQIGITPVDYKPGQEYISIGGAATSYYTSEGSTTKWIGVNSEYLTQTEMIETVNNQPTTVTKTAHIGFATATAAAPGLEVGDVSMIIDEQLKAALDKVAADVAAACAGKKRQACNTQLEYANRVNTLIEGGEGPFSNLASFSNVPVVAAADVSAVISKVEAAAPILGALVLAYFVAQDNNKGKDGPPIVAPVNNIPAGFNIATDAPTKTGCPPEAPKGSDAPVCLDDDCKGPDEGPVDMVRLCTEGPWKDCPCLQTLKAIAQQRDPVWLTAQQEVLQYIVDHDKDGDKTSPDPWCVHGASPHGNRVPSEYCQCGENYASFYSVITTGSNPCPYTTAPGPTITFADSTAAATPTSTPELIPGQPQCNVNPCPDVDGAKAAHPWLHLGDGLQRGKEFCASVNGEKSRGWTSVPYQNEKFWIHLKSEEEVKEDDCNLAVAIVLNGCDTCTNDVKFGGAVLNNGVTVLVKPYEENTSAENSPPAGQPTCSLNPCPDVEGAKKANPWLHLGTGMEKGKNFCSANKGKDTSGKGNDALYTTYDDASDHKWPDGKPATFVVHASSSEQKALNEDDCNNAIATALNGCDTCTNDAKFGGEVQVNGVTFEIYPVQYVPCLLC